MAKHEKSSLTKVPLYCCKINVNLIMNLDVSLRFKVKFAMFHFESFLADFIVNHSDPIYQQAKLFKLFI